MTTFHEVDNKGVRTNLKKMQTLLSVGLALSLAATSVAGERSRSSRNDRDAVRASGSTEFVLADRTVTVEVVAPGKLRMEANGSSMIVSQDGSIVLADVITEYGSLAEYQLTMTTFSVPAGSGPDGSTLFANGVVPYVASALGSNYPAPVSATVEDHKNRMAWISSSTSSGQEIVNFADGVVMQGMVSAIPATGGPSFIGTTGQTVYANGSVPFSR
jgi:hypothetical protein